jgi:hypothetical protein
VTPVIESILRASARAQQAIFAQEGVDCAV